MTDKEKNIEIAKLLGFKFIEPTEKCNFTQVIYPEDWKDEVKAFPITTVPDFLNILKQSREVNKMFKYGLSSINVNY